MAVNLGCTKAAIKHRLEPIPHLQLESYFKDLFSNLLHNLLHDGCMWRDHINQLNFLVLRKF